MTKSSYLDLINNFWTLHEDFNFSVSETALYFGLLNIANRLHWKDSFSKTNDYLRAFIGFNEKTLINSRHKLKQRGLIDFTTGKNKIPTKYRILSCNFYTQNNTQNDSLISTQNNTQNGKKDTDIIRHKEEDKEKDFINSFDEKNFLKKNFNSPPTEKSEELNEIEILRKKIFELENQKKALNNEEQPKKEKKVAAKKEKSKEILFSESDVAEFSEFEKRFSDSDYKLFDLRFYYEAVKNWSESKEAKKVNWVATARGFMLRDIQDGKAKMKNTEIVQQQNKKNYQNGSNNSYEQRQNERIARIQSSMQNVAGSGTE